MFAQGPGAFAVTLVAHRCIYRPSPAVDDFRAVLLLQPGLMCRHCHGAPALVVFMNTRLCWGCSSSIRASAVFAHKAGTENLPCPLIVHFPWGHLCMEGAEALASVQSCWGRTLCRQLGWAW